MKVFGTVAKDENNGNGGAFAPLFCVGYVCFIERYEL